MRDDVEYAINKFKVKTFGNKSNIERVAGKLTKSEKVIYIAPTNAIISSISTRKSEKLPGVLAITTERIIFSFKAMLSESTDIIPLTEIRIVNCKGNSITGSHIEINTITKNYDFLVSYKKEVRDELQSIINTAISNYRDLHNNSNSSVDFTVQLEKLFELKNKGVITEEEFEAKKKQLLNI